MVQAIESSQLIGVKTHCPDAVEQESWVQALLSLQTTGVLTHTREQAPDTLTEVSIVQGLLSLQLRIDNILPKVTIPLLAAVNV
jgi:hypothetical protein